MLNGVTCDQLYSKYVEDLSIFLLTKKIKISLEELLKLNVVYISKNKDFTFRVLGELKERKKKNASGNIIVSFKSIQVYSFSKKKMEDRNNIEIRSIYSDFGVFVKTFNQVKLIEKLRNGEKTMFDKDQSVEDFFGD